MSSNRIARRLAILMAILGSFVLRATSAWAQSYPGGGQTPPEVGGEQFFNGGGSKIPRTGTDILLFLLIALILLVLGIALHVAYRRRGNAPRGD
jgi:hypothetical protein